MCKVCMNKWFCIHQDLNFITSCYKTQTTMIGDLFTSILISLNILNLVSYIWFKEKLNLTGALFLLD